LSSDQVSVTLEYIEQHREEVLAEYAKIREREARGNPPELQAQLDATHAKYQARLAEYLLDIENYRGTGRIYVP
jgi:hypothetical protein